MAKGLHEILDELKANPGDTKLWNSHTWKGPSQSDIASWQAQGFGVSQGKLRTLLSRDGRLQLLASDRLTAFDRLIDYVPLKGIILSTISDFWFRSLSGVVSTHYIKQLGPRVLLVEATRPYKLEIVVRGYLAGSLVRAYAAGERVFYGTKLPEGLRPFERLPEPLITATTKAAAFEHDEVITLDEILKRKLCSALEWEQIGAMALKIFSMGSSICAQNGWLLVDSKYEFGRCSEDSIKLIDEVHTPDSARFWEAETYSSRLELGQPPRMLDKENIRNYLMQAGFHGFGDVPAVPKTHLIDLAKDYLIVAEKLVGHPLVLE